MNQARKKLIFFLPNVFTALNMACGYASIVFSLQGRFYYASLILILGAIFDSVDGRIARITGTESPFGEQFDSMSDVVSFGMAPALLFYRQFLLGTGKLGVVVTFVYVLCGALRLARFNANIEKVSSQYFQGLPIPAAAMALIGFSLSATDYRVLTQYPLGPGFYVFFFSLLMVSNIPFYSFKKSEWFARRRKLALFVIFLVLAASFIYETILITSIIVLYVLACLIYFFMNKGALEDIFDWEHDKDGSVHDEVY